MPLAGGASQIHDGLIRLIGALRVNVIRFRAKAKKSVGQHARPLA